MHFSPLYLLPFLHGAAIAFTSFLIPCLEAVNDKNVNTTTTFSFTFDDTNTNSTARCNGTLPIGAPVPTPYKACGHDPTFGWRFGRFNTIGDFELDLSRRFKDPAVGDPPFDEVTLFGRVNVTEGTSYRCHHDTRDACHVPRGSPIIVRINAAIA
ncbi:MAG: hypothetical protein M1826_005873 [Phylliscum demangeonii]|nr:MAG: hypothetical protein M1826_005873 [Phylliscum demangeonii]